VSLYGSTAAAHETVTKVAGSFERSLATLRTLRAAGVPCRVGSVLMPQTIGDFRGIAALASSLECGFMFDPTVAPCDDGSTDVLDLRIDAHRLTEFYLDEVIRPRSLEGRLAEAPQPPAERPAANCESGLTMASIDAYGDVYPCMGFPPAFGNLDESSFSTIWHGPVAEAHREAMVRPLHDCPDCELLPFCMTRCARLAAVEDGDSSGPSLRACEMARLTVELRKKYRGGGLVSPATNQRGDR
jgi:radical SAM protein with 4Fe4S-binding SPASM domain